MLLCSSLAERIILITQNFEQLLHQYNFYNPGKSFKKSRKELLNLYMNSSDLASNIHLKDLRSQSQISKESWKVHQNLMGFGGTVRKSQRNLGKYTETS